MSCGLAGAILLDPTRSYGHVVSTELRSGAIRRQRRLVLANVTTNPMALWLAHQVVKAFPWDMAPRFLIRDRDGAYGFAFSERSSRAAASFP